jgi:hypothetical protein
MLISSRFVIAQRKISTSAKFFIDSTGCWSRPNVHIFVLANRLEQLADFFAQEETLLHNVEVAEAAFLLHLCNITLKVNQAR